MTEKAILDAIGQEIIVGDIIYPTKGSSAGYSRDPFVVTRLGNTDKVQYNESSYLGAHLCVRITEQLRATKGESYVRDLQDKYVLNTTAVEKKISWGYTVLSLGPYSKLQAVRFAVVKAPQNSAERNKKVNEIVGPIREELKSLHNSEYIWTNTLNKKASGFCSYNGGCLTLAKIKELNLFEFIDKEVPAGTEQFEMLQKLVK